MCIIILEKWHLCDLWPFSPLLNDFEMTVTLEMTFHQIFCILTFFPRSSRARFYFVGYSMGMKFPDRKWKMPGMR